MELHAVCCTLLLLTCSGVCFGQDLVLPESIITTVGQDVQITPIQIPNGPHLAIRWKVNSTTILAGPLSGITILDPYKDRARLTDTTLALELRTLTESDTGPYELSIEHVEQRYAAETLLQVFVPVSDVTIVSSQVELVEFNSSVSLVCSASGSSLSFIWLNGSSEVTSGERVQLTDNNSTLTITSVIRGDTGPYQCKASNMVGEVMSPLLSLIIYYGPKNVAVAADPEGPFYSPGSNLKLTCSAESSPSAEFQWAVNGTELGKMSQELELSNIQINQSGNYTCTAHNKQSLRYATSQPVSVTVLELENAGGDGGSLSSGAIAGIVLGVLLGVAGIVGLSFYFIKVTGMPTTNSRENKQSGATQNAGKHDSEYENISFQNKNTGVTVGGSDTQMRHTPHPDNGLKRTDVTRSEKRK